MPLPPKQIPGKAAIGPGGQASVGKNVDAVPLGPEDIPKVSPKDPTTILQSLAPGKKAIFMTGKGIKFYIQKTPDGSFNVHHMNVQMEPKPINPRVMTPEEVITIIDDHQAGFIAQESRERSMTSENYIKLDLLRRKISEHFAKKPKAKSVVIEANIGKSRTAWKVSRRKSGYHIVEVNTSRKEFLVEAPMGVAQVPGRASAGVTDPKKAKQMMAMAIAQADAKTWGDPQGRAAMLMQYNQLAGIMDTQASKAFKDLLSSMGISETEFDKAESGQFGAIPGAPQAAAPGSSLKAGRIREIEDEEPKKKSKTPVDPNDPENPKNPKDQEGDPNDTPDPEGEPEPEAPSADIAPEDTSLETGDNAEPVTGAQTGEELQLQQLAARGGPIKTIRVETDKEGGTITLTLASLENDIIINTSNSGKASFNFGEMHRVLKTGFTEKG